MMKVTFYRDSESFLTGFQVSGHAGYAKRGKDDILCSAVSALTVNTVNSIEKFTEDRPLYRAVNESEGFMHFRLKTVSDKSRLLLDSLLLGLSDIAESYGNFISIEFEEV